jgi:hypothetical protein
MVPGRLSIRVVPVPAPLRQTAPNRWVRIHRSEPTSNISTSNLESTIEASAQGSTRNLATSLALATWDWQVPEEMYSIHLVPRTRLTLNDNGRYHSEPEKGHLVSGFGDFVVVGAPVERVTAGRAGNVTLPSALTEVPPRIRLAGFAYTRKPSDGDAANLLHAPINSDFQAKHCHGPKVMAERSSVALRIEYVKLSAKPETSSHVLFSFASTSQAKLVVPP